jgi:hypothetical protein
MFQIIPVILLTLMLSTQAYAETILPKIAADDLNGRILTLPADLPGDPTIVFVAYKQNQQPQINAWVSRLDLQPEGGPAWVELPVVGQGAALIRSVIDNGMRSGITSKAMRGRTITIYSNRRAFNKSMGITDMSKIYVALVDQSGAVRTLIPGEVSDAKIEQLRAAYR